MKIPESVDAMLYAVATAMWVVVVFFGLCFWHMIAAFGSEEEGEL